MKNGTLGSVSVLLDRSEANALLHMLGVIAALEESNVYSDDARKLMNKILKHGRTYSQKGADKVSIYFYDNEATKLIMLMSLYLSSGQYQPEDFFPSIGRKHNTEVKKGLGIPNSAEQNTQTDSQQ